MAVGAWNGTGTVNVGAGWGFGGGRMEVGSVGLNGVCTPEPSTAEPWARWEGAPSVPVPVPRQLRRRETSVTDTKWPAHHPANLNLFSQTAFPKKNYNVEGKRDREVMVFTNCGSCG